MEVHIPDLAWPLFLSPLLVTFWALWLLRQRGPTLLLLPPRRRAVPWSGAEIVIVVLFGMGIWPLLASAILRESGFLSWLYGPAFLDDIDGNDPVLRKQALHRLTAWQQALAWPLCMATLLAVPCAVSGTRLYQLGLTARRLWQDVVIGVLSWLALTPFVIGIYLVLGELMRRWGVPPTEHPLTELSRSGARPMEWGLIFVNAVAAAPLYEELLFRGLLQPWFANRPRGGDIALAASAILAAVHSVTPFNRAVTDGNVVAALLALAPMLFVLAMTVLYLPLRLRATTATAGIFGTALLFGVAHSAVWPSPIPLFVLGAGLGMLAYRTQSIVPSVVVHALFNAVAFVQLLFPHLPNGKDATAAALRAPPISISTTVPGSE